MTALVQSLLRSDHSLVALPISALAARPSGWVQDVDFLLVGTLLTAYAIGLHLGVSRTRWDILSPAFLVISGVGVALAGAFPAVDENGAFSYDQVGHTVASFMAFLAAWIGLLFLSRRLARDPNWRSLAAYTIAIVVLFFAFCALAQQPGTPLHPWIGLFQWVL